MMPSRNRPPVPPIRPSCHAETGHLHAAGIDEILPSPVHHNLHPLRVHGLDHYVIVDDEGQRYYVH